MSVLQIVHMIVSAALITVILFQNKSAGLSGVFGGSGTNTFSTKRGPEKMIFAATIVLAIAFISISLLFIIL